MSAAAVPGADIPAGDLEGLRRAICKRAAWETRGYNDDRDHIFPALGLRIQQALNGRTEGGQLVYSDHAMTKLFADLEADMRGLLALPAGDFKRCVEGRATNPRGFNQQHALQGAQWAREQAVAVALPRVQPTELLQRLARAGIIVQAIDGNLHVHPAELLSEADRAALVANKAAFLEALSRPAEVL